MITVESIQAIASVHGFSKEQVDIIISTHPKSHGQVARVWVKGRSAFGLIQIERGYREEDKTWEVEDTVAWPSSPSPNDLRAFEVHSQAVAFAVDVLAYFRNNG